MSGQPSSSSYKPAPVSLGDRLATAFCSALLMVVSIIALYFFVHRWGFRWSRVSDAGDEFLFSRRGVVSLAGGAAIVGFLVGPRIMAQCWEWIWRVFD